MADTGIQAPTAAETADETPWTGANFAWLTPANIYGAGEASIVHPTFDAGVYSQVLKAYSFDFSAIPDGSTIDGVQVVINARYATAICALSLAQLLDTSRAKVGTNKYATPVNLTTSAADYTIGGSADKWGNALDAAWVKDPNFGVAIGVIVGASNNCDVFVDSVTMQVWYTAPAGGPKYAYPADNAGISDNVNRVVGHARALGDVVGLTDGVYPESTTAQEYDRTPGDNMGMSDSAVRSMIIRRGVES